MFPLSCTGEIAIDAASEPQIPAVLDRLEGALQTAKARSVARSESRIDFRGSWGHGPLSVVSRGEIEVVEDPQTVAQYAFYFGRYLAMTAIATVVYSLMGYFADPVFYILVPFTLATTLGVIYFFSSSVGLPHFVRKAALGL